MCVLETKLFSNIRGGSVFEHDTNNLLTLYRKTVKNRVGNLCVQRL